MEKQSSNGQLNANGQLNREVQYKVNEEVADKVKKEVRLKVNREAQHKVNQEDQHKGFNNEARQGSEILSLLQPQAGERILDLGCGNGGLTVQLADAGAVPTGIDWSEEMVSKAMQQYPGLNFQAIDACHYRSDTSYDAVFSHAVLHWIQDAPAVARTVWLALGEGGRFVAEFAGKGNAAVMTGAIRGALEAHGYEWEVCSPWYHPTIGEYASLLEDTGFRVVFAQHVEKPTQLKGDQGVQRWLAGFDEYFFADVNPADKASIYRMIEEKVEPRLKQGGQWMLDTCRLRIVAVKETS